MSGVGPPPTFEHRDPQAAEFWTERYAKAFTPWDQGGAPMALTQALVDGALPVAPAKVLVPGCGSGHELALLDSAGYDWLAIDLAPLAVEQARARLASPAAQQRVRVTDFFALDTAAGFRWIYERAFLCALPPASWPSLIAHAARLLERGGVWAGLFFHDDEAASAERRRGPPFAASTEELQTLMAPHFMRVADLAVPREQSLAAFTGHERWQVWQRR
ncbi:hypothetical protein BH09PSE6_BH09PSE6_12210 [soil metagenome]